MNTSTSFEKNQESLQAKSYKSLKIIFRLYSLFWILYLVTYWVFGDKIGLVALSSNCIPTALAPSFLGVAVGIKRRDRILTFLSGVLVAFLLIEYGPRFIPKNWKIREEQNTLSVLSHNMGQNLPGYTKRTQLIIDNEPDIVILQEITQEYIDRYWDELLEKYPHNSIGVLQADRDQNVGMAILSKYPLLEVNNFKLADKGLVFQQRAIIDVNGQQIVVYNIHTTFPWIRLAEKFPVRGILFPIYDDFVRRSEIEKLIQLLMQEKAPVILAGDFNFNDQSSDYQKLRAINFTDAFRNAGIGLGFTWPANRTPSVNIRPATPLVRVDYLFHTPDFQSLDAMVLNETGSDHKPLLTKLSLSR